ncbi:helix-turn-helix domain-containing protein [Trujillonella endophytica]|uniref:Homeodomain-like domain-containing protein n=1 Tax=Trujillonella endophytica TaxID=673521 RepID=A0A1H8QXF5_9ACTN|nr:helix-turn-helix domain-containing protein [Trujillella endophytica]SEO58855.1 Homeodomain-like domain-containing protein [Trujillella endophytica]
MADTVAVAAAAADDDPAVGLRAVRSLRVLVERLEALQVAQARSRGWTWEQIAHLLGVSRQAVHKKHASGRGPLRRKD